MPAFTTPLHKAFEYAGSTGLNDYPIFDEKYRENLNQRILEHYHEQEIFTSSPIEFVFALRRRMFEIMPKYNRLYLSERMEIDPLKTVNISTVFTSDQISNSSQSVETIGKSDSKDNSVIDTTANGTSENESINHSETDSDGSSTDSNTTTTATENKARTTNSNMPQARLSGNKDYATSGTDVISGVDTTVNTDTDSSNANNSVTDSKTNDTGATNDTSNTVGSNTGSANTESNTDGISSSEDKIRTENHEIGWNGNQSEMIMRYRETFMNVDLMVINELGDLFMLLWNTTDDYENKGFGYGY